MAPATPSAMAALELLGVNTFRLAWSPSTLPATAAAAISPAPTAIGLIKLMMSPDQITCPGD